MKRVMATKQVLSIPYKVIVILNYTEDKFYITVER